MRLKAIISINNDEIHNHDISIGNGCQTFKWLGLLACERLIMWSPQGELRHRERPSIVGRNCRYVPSEIYSDEQKVPYHPEYILKDHLQDGQEVNITVTDRFETDDFDRPQLSRWAFIAFNLSEAKSHERQQLISDYEQELRAFQLKNKKIVDKARSDEDMPKIAEMREIMQEQLLNEEMTRQLMKKDWELIHSSGALEGLLPDADEQTETLHLLTKHYAQLTELFKSVSAVTSGGGSTAAIELVEFTVFMNEMNFFPEGVPSHEISKIFLKSLLYDPENAGGIGIHAEMRLHEFVLSLINIAYYKYVKLAKKSMGRRLVRARLPTIPIGLEKLITDFLEPALTGQLDGLWVKSLLTQDEILLFLHPFRGPLQALFDDYASRVTDRRFPPDAFGMKEFSAIIRDRDLLGPTVSADGRYRGAEVSMKNVRRIFSACQQDSASAFYNDMEDTYRSIHQQQMLFAEFIESIIRLSLYKFPYPKVELLSKMAWTFEKLCQYKP